MSGGGEGGGGRPGPPDPPLPLWRDLARLAEELATEAGALLLDGLRARRVPLTASTKSSSTDLVTEFDRASERLLVERILAARPHDGIVGEEGTDHDGTSGVRWVLDPLDGTTNYFYGHPGFGVSVAAEVAGPGVVAGAVADPTHGETYVAVRGGGAWCSTGPLAVADPPDLQHALVATGFSYEPERRRRQAEVLVEVLPRVRDIRRMGAAAVDLCAVAAGRADAFYERGLQEWDHAAGVLVATEAGATCGDLAGGPVSSRFALAAAPGIFEELRDLLFRAGAADA